MDKWPSLKATKRSGHHQKNKVGPILQWGERLYETLNLWIKCFSTWRLHCSHWNRAASQRQLCEYLSARHRKPERALSLCPAEKSLCVSGADTSACCAPAQNAAFGSYLSSPHRTLQSGQEQPGSWYLFTPGLSKQLAQACLTLYCHIWCHTFLPGRWGLWGSYGEDTSTCTWATLANLVPVQLINLICGPCLLCKVDITTTSSRVSYSSIIANVNICS